MNGDASMHDDPQRPECDATNRSGDAVVLPVDPHLSVHTHFGMLMGTADFELLSANPRGKTWLHSAWLHGAGVVWGFKVDLNADQNEIRVHPGLALDCRGRELYLSAASCVNLVEWYRHNRDDGQYTFHEVGGAGTVRFAVQVVVQFKACLTRQVPALVEPCEGASVPTAYSRVWETVELSVVPANTLPTPDARYPRLRRFFGLGVGEADADVEKLVAEKLNMITAEAVETRAEKCVDVLRELAALDAANLSPPATEEGEPREAFPQAPPVPVLLADVDVVLMKSAEDDWRLVESESTADISRRPTLLPASIVQELLASRSV